jgi:hypothetical protein
MMMSFTRAGRIACATLSLVAFTACNDDDVPVPTTATPSLDTPRPK